ncbi:hypothetical protein DEDE109153_14595 [Deinococcus deserti]|uniref:Uncharacterized protein n=1 Tax=Deinococcus deserti (strain DSM 17065 / CIP 109153 / LMG 22923 / VCD115) TaxID=546414 RepID=C1CY41_DEIDV|nr:hypothetical protein [Deinococcus deserti]ACO46997.1 hypothetical protein; putative membrane protein [Deinococcus deserti VCD115]
MPVLPSAHDTLPGRRRLLLASLLLTLAGTLLAMVLARNDRWDLQVDRPLYAALALAIALLWWSTWRSRLPLHRSTQALIGCAAVFMALKLSLLGVVTVDQNVTMQELMESLSWLSPVMAWALATASSHQMRRVLMGLLGVVGVLSAGLVAQRSAGLGELDRDLLRVALQLNLPGWCITAPGSICRARPRSRGCRANAKPCNSWPTMTC